MPSPTFRFKQFTIRHDRSSMKVGTDGVLLGAWAACLSDVPSIASCLDIGTGSGLIALMLAQRFPQANIDAIDIDDASLQQAQENVDASPFSSKIFVVKRDFNSINEESNKYDLIASNPPFYKEYTFGGDEVRDAARHTASLPFERLISNASRLLSKQGIFSVIIPYGEAAAFISLCATEKLYLTRRTDVRTREKKAFKRTLLEFQKEIRSASSTTLTLLDTLNNRTVQYTELTKDFYL